MKVHRRVVEVAIPPTVLPRVERAAEMRGLSVEDYIVAMLQWHSPAYDNDAQYLKSQIRNIVVDLATNETKLNEIEALVK